MARLHVAGLTSEELDVALITLLGCIPGDIPKAVAPLYNRDDLEDLVTAMPSFNEWGLEPPDHPDSPVVLSSGDNGGDEDSKEMEEDDLWGTTLNAWAPLCLGVRKLRLVTVHHQHLWEGRPAKA